jgi:hypothetical protein
MSVRPGKGALARRAGWASLQQQHEADLAMTHSVTKLGGLRRRDLADVETIELQRAARVAALSLLNARSCGELLRDSGEHRHALNWDAAVDALSEILVRSIGRERLADALDWATDQYWRCQGNDRTTLLN